MERSVWDSARWTGCHGVQRMHDILSTVHYTIKGSVSAFCIGIAVTETFESKWSHLLKC